MSHNDQRLDDWRAKAHKLVKSKKRKPLPQANAAPAQGGGGGRANAQMRVRFFSRRGSSSRRTCRVLPAVSCAVSHPSVEIPSPSPVPCAVASGGAHVRLCLRAVPHEAPVLPVRSHTPFFHHPHASSDSQVMPPQEEVLTVFIPALRGCAGTTGTAGGRGSPCCCRSTLRPPSSRLPRCAPCGPLAPCLGPPLLSPTHLIASLTRLPTPSTSSFLRADPRPAAHARLLLGAPGQGCRAQPGDG